MATFSLTYARVAGRSRLSKTNNMKVGQLGIPLSEHFRLGSTSDWEGHCVAPYEYALSSTETGRAITKMLAEDSRVSELRRVMVARGSGAERFDPTKLAKWYLWRENSQGQEVARRDLENFLSSEHGDAIVTLWLTGIAPKSDLSLSNEIRLVPVEKMPETRDRAEFLYSRAMLDFHVRPTAALVKECKIRIKWRQDPVPQDQPLIDNFWAVNKELGDVGLLINAAKGAFCSPYLSTAYLPDSLPFGPFSMSGGGAMIQDVVTRGRVVADVGLGQTVASLHKIFSVLSGSDKTRFRLVLDRLGQAKRRGQLEDKILDLGITLEMLLLPDNKSGDQLSQSFRLRGAWLVGRDPKERVAVCALLKTLYTLRSVVAHGGTFTKNQREEASMKGPEFEELAERVLCECLARPSIDWQELLLGDAEKLPARI
jgi:hypothetical protein